MRTQTLQKLSLEEMSTPPGKYIFHISSLKANSAKGGQNRHLFPITFTSYNVDERLCVVKLLTAYIEGTTSIRKNTKQLLICYVAPHGPASKDAISRWIRQTMKDAGINTSVFKPHSTMGAATSAAKAANVRIHEIMNTAGWRSHPPLQNFMIALSQMKVILQRLYLLAVTSNLFGALHCFDSCTISY